MQPHRPRPHTASARAERGGSAARKRQAGYARQRLPAWFCLLLLGTAACVDAERDTYSADRLDERTGTGGGQQALQVRVANGTVEGRVVGNTREFFEIPYAKPPTGKLRFAPPEPADSWDGVRQAKEARVQCIQGPRGQMKTVMPLPGVKALVSDEDCLFIHVYTPNQPASERLPVLVFLHGGGNMWGNGAGLDGRYLSEAGGMVVVTLNYRLAALGGLVLPELDREIGRTSGNLFLLDQQLALRWVQQNIAAFGGDPANVTLAGESAGSFDTCYHLFATGSRGLFQRAILESGSCVAENTAVFERDTATLVERSRQIGAAICPNAPDLLACLRDADAETVGMWAPEQWSIQDFVGTFGAYVDGQLLPDHPSAMLARQQVNAVPVLLGANARELFFISAPIFGFPWPLFEDSAALAFFELLAPGLLSTYGASVLELPLMPAARVNEIGIFALSDVYLRCPTRALARGLSRLGADVRLYSFELTPATHGLELDYVFGWPDGMYTQLYTDAQKPPSPAMIRDVQKYWTSFATDGHASGPAVWPRYDEAELHLVLGANITTGTGFARASCDVIDSAPGLAGP